MKKKQSITRQYGIIFFIIMLLAGVAIGSVLIFQSSSALKKVIQNHMLDLSTTAASVIDGDDLATVNETTLDSVEYKSIYKQLSMFLSNENIKYIYIVRKIDENKFVFIIDPDPISPAAYGEEIVITEALISAGKGVAMVDDSPMKDRWGNFYTSYSPVFDSNGVIAGIVGVDFDSEAYDHQIRSIILLTILISSLFVVAGEVLFFIINHRMHKRFVILDEEIASLSNDVDELTNDFKNNPDYKKFEEQNIGLDDAEDTSEDELTTIGHRIKSMSKEMKNYLDYTRVQVNTDPLTSVGNVASYINRRSEINDKIDDGTADFAVVFFDISGLKEINDEYGHNIGDQIIILAAQCISKVFEIENTFRIGGDEFIVIIEEVSKETIEQKIKEVGLVIDDANRSANDLPILNLPAGYAIFDKNKDRYFLDVLNRSDENMYSEKRRIKGIEK